MKTLEIFESRKDEIVEATLNVLPGALAGDLVNRVFYCEVDEETGKLTVDYYCYIGQTYMSSRCFYTIPAHETPDPAEYGFDTIGDMDFEAVGYREYIESAIDQHVEYLEILEEIDNEKGI